MEYGVELALNPKGTEVPPPREVFDVGHRRPRVFARLYSLAGLHQWSPDDVRRDVLRGETISGLCTRLGGRAISSDHTLLGDKP